MSERSLKESFFKIFKEKKFEKNKNKIKKI